MATSVMLATLFSSDSTLTSVPHSLHLKVELLIIFSIIIDGLVKVDSLDLWREEQVGQLNKEVARERVQLQQSKDLHGMISTGE